EFRRRATGARELRFVIPRDEARILASRTRDLQDLVGLEVLLEIATDGSRRGVRDRQSRITRGHPFRASPRNAAAAKKRIPCLLTIGDAPGGKLRPTLAFVAQGVHGRLRGRRGLARRDAPEKERTGEERQKTNSCGVAPRP